MIDVFYQVCRFLTFLILDDVDTVDSIINDMTESNSDLGNDKSVNDKSVKSYLIFAGVVIIAVAFYYITTGAPPPQQIVDQLAPFSVDLITYIEHLVESPSTVELLRCVDILGSVTNSPTPSGILSDTGVIIEPSINGVITETINDVDCSDEKSKN